MDDMLTALDRIAGATERMEMAKRSDGMEMQALLMGEAQIELLKGILLELEAIRLRLDPPEEENDFDA